MEKEQRLARERDIFKIASTLCLVRECRDCLSIHQSYGEVAPRGAGLSMIIEWAWMGGHLKDHFSTLDEAKEALVAEVEAYPSKCDCTNARRARLPRQ